MSTELFIDLFVIAYAIICLFTIERILFRKAVTTSKVIKYASRKGLDWTKDNVGEKMTRGRKVWKCLIVAFSGLVLLGVLAFVIPYTTVPISPLNFLFCLITSIGLISYGGIKALAESVQEMSIIYSFFLMVFIFFGFLYFLRDTEKTTERSFFSVYVYYIGFTILLISRYFKKYKYR